MPSLLNLPAVKGLAVFAASVLLFPVITELLGNAWAGDAPTSASASGGAMGGIFGYLEYRR